MAIQDQEELLQGQQTARTGTTIAGSGGASGGANVSASAAPTPQAGSGFTNLQQYLSANSGQGAGLANEIAQAGQAHVQADVDKANSYASDWAKSGVQQAQSGAQDALNDYNKGTQAYNANNKDEAASYNTNKSYAGPTNANAISGYNELEKGYQNAKDAATAYGNNYDAQKAALQKAHGYGSGFGALDTFLARQDGRDTLQGWTKKFNPGNANSYVDQVNKAIGDNQAAVSKAKDDYWAAMRDYDKRNKPVIAPPPPNPPGGIASNTPTPPEPPPSDPMPVPTLPPPASIPDTFSAPKTPTNVFTAANGMAQSIPAAAQTASNQAIDTAQTAGNKVIDWSQDRLHTGNPMIDKPVTAVMDKGQEIGDKLVNGAQKVVNKTADNGKEVVNKILSGFSGKSPAKHTFDGGAISLNPNSVVGPNSDMLKDKPTADNVVGPGSEVGIGDYGKLDKGAFSDQWWADFNKYMQSQNK